MLILLGLLSNTTALTPIIVSTVTTIITITAIIITIISANPFSNITRNELWPFPVPAARGLLVSEQ